MEGALSIRCPKCKGSFRDKAAPMQSGYSRQCPSCEVLLFFEEFSPDKDVKRAVNGEKNLRRKLAVEGREREEAKRLS